MTVEKIREVVMVMKIFVGHRRWCLLSVTGGIYIGIYIVNHGELFAGSMVARKDGLRELSENNNTDEKKLSMASA
jgi:hypothetical protein